MVASPCDTVWRNARLATMAGPGLGIVERGVVAARDGRIVYAGDAQTAPTLAAKQEIDCDGRWITPGLIDCHTHIIHAGDRAGEFEERLKGVSYEDIARRGGGIVTTVSATREASVDDLARGAMGRVRQLMGEGVTTLEIKSGYGLSLDAEMNMLRAARALGTMLPLRVTTTLLGAHALPPEFAGNRDAYVDLVADEMIPFAAQAGLADAVDAFCERIAFTRAETERVFAAAQRAGLPVKLHAEQLSDQKGASLAAQYGALSADHLEHLDELGARAMAEAGTVATLLPGAYYFTRETHPPPVDMLRRLEISIALASDCNPGTSPMASILLAMNMGATLFRLTVEECLRGVTRNGARALGLQHETGALAAGMSCDLALWNVEKLAELVYRIGANPLHARVYRGAVT